VCQFAVRLHPQRLALDATQAAAQEGAVRFTGKQGQAARQLTGQFAIPFLCI
jgi:hypothetical protein